MEPIKFKSPIEIQVQSSLLNDATGTSHGYENGAIQIVSKEPTISGEDIIRYPRLTLYNDGVVLTHGQDFGFINLERATDDTTSSPGLCKLIIGVGDDAELTDGQAKYRELIECIQYGAPKGYSQEGFSAVQRKIILMDENGHTGLRHLLLHRGEKYGTYSEGNLVVEGTATFGSTEETSTKITDSGIISKKEIQAASFYATSDARLKTNLRPLQTKKSILDLPLYKFDFINGTKDQIGCLAQDLQEICPELVKENEEGNLVIQENKLIYLLLKELQEMKNV